MRNTTKLATLLVALVAALLIAPTTALALAPASALADEGAMLVPASVPNESTGTDSDMPGHGVQDNASGDVNLDDDFTVDESDIVTSEQAVDTVISALEAHAPAISVPIRIQIDEALPDDMESREEMLQGLLRGGMKDLVEGVFAEDGDPTHGDYFRWTLSKWTYSAKGKLEQIENGSDGADGEASGEGSSSGGSSENAGEAAGGESSGNGSEGSEGGSSVGSESTSSIIALYTLEFEYRCSADEDAYTVAAATQIVDALAAENPAEWQTKLGRVKVIYDYICSHVSYYYAEDYADNSDFKDYRDHELQFTAYAALKYGTAVCQGYDVLFYLMANYAGVETRIVSGLANDGVNHGWNIVNISEAEGGNEWYNLDPTWDSDRFAAGAPYEYFLKSDVEFASDHIRGNGDRDKNGNLLYGSVDYTAASSGDDGQPAFPSTVGASYEPQVITHDGVEYEAYTSTATAVGFAGDATDTQRADVDIPASVSVNGSTYTVTEIGAYFAANTSVEAVDGGNRITVHANKQLKSVAIPNTVKRIGAAAFAGCVVLAAPALPSSLKIISQRAFWSCIGTGFNSITVPASVEAIGDSAFEGCSNLKTVKVMGEKTSIGYDAFKDLAPDSTLSVSAEQHDAMAVVPAITTGNTVVVSSTGANIHGTLTHAACTATCTTAGIGEHWMCPTCGSAFKDKSATTPISTSEYNLAALGHSWGKWTKLNDTQHQHVCTHDSSHVEKANHTWDAGKVTKAATTTSTGVRTYTCTGCGATKTETIAKLAAASTSGATSSSTSSATSGATPTNASAKTNTSTSTSAKSTSNAANTSTATSSTANTSGATSAKTRTSSTASKSTTGAAATAAKQVPVSIAKATVSGIANKTYTGKALTQNPVVKLDSKTLKAGTDYVVAYVGNKNAGTASVVIKGKGSYTGSVTKTFKIAKAKNTLTAKAKSKVNTVKAKTLKSKNVTIKKTKAFKVMKAKGKVTFKKSSGNKKITVSKAGKITIKKGLKKGTYRVKVKVTAKGNANYKSATKTVTLKIRVK